MIISPPIVMMMNFDALEELIQMVVINLKFVLQSNVIIFSFYLMYQDPR